MQHSHDFDMEEEKKPASRVFPIVLAICLIAVCGVAVTAFVSNIAVEEPVDPQTTTSVTTTTTTAKSVQQVVIPATDILDDRTTTVTTTTTTTAPKALFVFPVSNRIVNSYSETHVFSDTLGEWVTHNGVDFEAQVDAPVKAIADGEVATIHEDALWGNTVELKHEGNVVTRYCGVTAAKLKKGQKVSAGEVIGTVATVPAEVLMPSHLHVEMLVNNSYIDPLTMITGETVIVKQETK